MREQLAQSVTLIEVMQETVEAIAERVGPRVRGRQRDLGAIAFLAKPVDAAHQQARQAQQAADELRRAEKARQGRGRLAHVLTAWRGE